MRETTEEGLPDSDGGDQIDPPPRADDSEIIPLEGSQAARADFKRERPCPANQQPTGQCPGYIIDHVIALKRGGPDAPANMQWQTVDEAKAKDRVE